MSFGLKVAAAVAAFVAVVFVVLVFEAPPMDTAQIGYRGVAMEQVTNPRLQAARVAANQVPEPVPAVPAEGPKASEVYQNVQVLGNLSAAQFNRLMVAITAWVSPEQGCNYCHKEGAALSDDSLYTKVVARRMLQMTQDINSKWNSHVGATGVTCYTCHRGQPVPANVWFLNPEVKGGMAHAGWRNGQNMPARAAALASLPSDPFSPYLSGKQEIRVLGGTPLPQGHEATIQTTEGTYALMMHMSDALGVNCTFCHNSRSFKQWDQSTPQRATAWHAIRMVRDVNNAYLDPLQPKYPPHRLGPLGDAAKANCTTCHQGVNKPLLGVSMLKDYPELGAPAAAAAAAPAPPPPTVMGDVVIIFFAVDSTELHGAAPAAMDGVIARLKADPAAKAKLSGFHSATGDPARNHELAKSRAMAVRDALKAAGVAEDRVVLEKPLAEQANVAGEDWKARRVEVSITQ